MQPDTWKRFEFHWWWPSFLIGFALATRRDHAEEGLPYLGWQFDLHIGPATVSVNGRDRDMPGEATDA